MQDPDELQNEIDELEQEATEAENRESALRRVLAEAELLANGYCGSCGHGFFCPAGGKRPTPGCGQCGLLNRLSEAIKEFRNREQECEKKRNRARPYREIQGRMPLWRMCWTPDTPPQKKARASGPPGPAQETRNIPKGSV